MKLSTETYRAMLGGVRNFYAYNTLAIVILLLFAACNFIASKRTKHTS